MNSKSLKFFAALGLFIILCLGTSAFFGNKISSEWNQAAASSELARAEIHQALKEIQRAQMLYRAHGERYAGNVFELDRWLVRPAASLGVDFPGMEFYVLRADEESFLAQGSFAPNGNSDLELWTIEKKGEPIKTKGPQTGKGRVSTANKIGFFVSLTLAFLVLGFMIFRLRKLRK